jgi:sulfite exporter TauE/SafE
MSMEIAVLGATAASLGFIHTLLGPDHYIPFVAMARARAWSVSKTAVVTLLCGAGHILSSVVLGLVGVAFGIGVTKLEALEGIRGNIAGWLLVGFGFTYLIWGIHKAVRNKPHSHGHVHDDLTLHAHGHSHVGDHTHVHDEHGKNITPWVLFTIFIFGPCEPLIPIVMYPAAKHSMTGLLLVTAVFGVVTILTMLGVVFASLWGMSFVRMGRAERYAHALAGASILVCGIAVQFLGL